MPQHTTDDGCHLVYTTSGDAALPPLLLINALGTDRGLWAAQIDALSTHHRVIAYDARGHGASDAPAGPYSVERLGGDARSLLDRLGVDRADVCGVSIGGLTALWLAVHAADRVRQLVLANTAARIGSVELWTERMRMAGSQGLESLADPTMARWFTPAFREASADTVARFRATLLRLSVDGYVSCCAALRDGDLRHEASRVGVRTLVVAGRHDVATPPSDATFLAGAIPGATLVELDAAHLANVEQAAAFTAAVGQFLRS
jgi:3-oxoadipate enol-lactonase